MDGEPSVKSGPFSVRARISRRKEAAGKIRYEEDDATFNLLEENREEEGGRNSAARERFSAPRPRHRCRRHVEHLLAFVDSAYELKGGGSRRRDGDFEDVLLLHLAQAARSHRGALHPGESLNERLRREYFSLREERHLVLTLKSRN